MKGRLVAVSNRVSSVRSAPLAGGLAVALVDALRENKGLWFGWSGKTAAESSETPVVVREGDITLATVDLSQQDHDAYYSGFANNGLWPLFHFRLDLTSYDRAHFLAYQQVNQRFAKALLPLLREDDLIWVHDYHLFPMGSELRKLGVQQRLGYYLHIPFPPRELLTTLPQHEALVRALFDYDVVGFQIEDDVKRLASYVEQDLGGKVGLGWMEAFGKRVRVEAFPVGIDTARFHDFAFSSHGQREYTRIREFLRDRQQIIGVDRLDYSKGLVRRMNAYELLLEDHRDAHGRITYLQVAPISRGEVTAYQDYRKELEQHAASINGRFGQVDWVPIRYVNEPIPRRRLAGLYRASRIGLVTPMRDGMNLVAKEYVAAQDKADPGVLVLSRFAGAAMQMRDALLVNPYDTEEVAGALERARLMPVEERSNRHEKLMKGLLEEDVSHWRTQFLAALSQET